MAKKTTNKEIAKNSPEMIANEKTIRLSIKDANDNHPTMTSFVIMGGSYLAGKKIIAGLSDIVNAGTGTYKLDNRPADTKEDLVHGIKNVGTGLLYGVCTLGSLYLLSKDN